MAFLVMFGVLWMIFIWPPAEFSQGKYFYINQGDTLSHIAYNLGQEQVIKSPFAFKVITKIVLARGNSAFAGEYFFEKPLNAFSVARRIVNGIFVTEPIKVTIPEGLTKFQTAELIQKSIPQFDVENFVTNSSEGYIYPDTYFLVPNIKSREMIRMTKSNFDAQIATIADGIEAFGRPLEDVIKMASILETEANNTEDRRMIAGILWSRLDIKMPLQVDVSFRYINGKNSFELTGEDLDIDSPYNSYKYTGLPPTPISNPSLDSIQAAITPIETENLYFLSGRDGKMHYAEDFEGHKKNRALYLD